jgi:hypothetical protein
MLITNKLQILFKKWGKVGQIYSKLTKQTIKQSLARIGK